MFDITKDRKSCYNCCKVNKSKKNQRGRGTSFQVRGIVIIALVITLVSLAIFCRWRMNDPRRVFDAMLENSLRTRSVTKTVNQTDEYQNMKQTTQLLVGSQNITRGLIELSQGEGTSVVTESIGTPTEDFFRYTAIKTDQLSESGAPLDFSQAINVWGRTSNTFEDGSTNGQLYGEMVLGIIPIGYLNPSDRKELLSEIKSNNVYEVDYGKVNRSNIKGRPTYKYEVKMKPEAYVNLLKKFAKKVGLTQLENVDSSVFKDSPLAEMTVTVDVWSRQLTGLEMAGTGRNEIYWSYGAKISIDQPTDTIPVEVLQEKLQSVQ